ncbi:hypothetical protein M404DRAFT_992461 [Pisolithus tinctorius Marx 270]|uniref:Uncharacterized protein n=1 Tax=Pisolithus tinctorius Marx 270 TaxID=870435 RepID=A0A0C3PXL3_PISTI|nr:hypothetical protein M404DRAFT_992461 [Pisolithus tinctorius Marx 270]
MKKSFKPSLNPVYAYSQSVSIRRLAAQKLRTRRLRSKILNYCGHYQNVHTQPLRMHTHEEISHRRTWVLPIDLSCPDPHGKTDTDRLQYRIIPYRRRTLYSV